MNSNRIGFKSAYFLTRRLHLYVETILLLVLFAGPFFWRANVVSVVQDKWLGVTLSNQELCALSLPCDTIPKLATRKADATTVSN